MLLNPAARGGRAAALEPQLRTALASSVPAATLLTPRGAEQAQTAVLAAPMGSRVVVVGGDGTLHRLLPALVQRRCEVALVPAGSGDDTARALGLKGWPWRRALHHGLSAPAASSIDLARAVTPSEARLFVSSLAAGFDAAVALRALTVPAWLRGSPRYLVATLCEVARLKLWQLRVVADGVPVRDDATLFASTLNTASYGAGMPAVGPARLDDGLLDLLVAGRFGRMGALLMLPRLLAGRHLGHREVRTLRFHRLELHSHTPLPLAADGEAMAAANTVAVEVLAGALRVVAAR